MEHAHCHWRCSTSALKTGHGQADTVGRAHWVTGLSSAVGQVIASRSLSVNAYVPAVHMCSVLVLQTGGGGAASNYD